jgi:hypothetical protein
MHGAVKTLLHVSCMRTAPAADQGHWQCQKSLLQSSTVHEPSNCCRYCCCAGMPVLLVLLLRVQH